MFVTHVHFVLLHRRPPQFGNLTDAPPQCPQRQRRFPLSLNGFLQCFLWVPLGWTSSYCGLQIWRLIYPVCLVCIRKGGETPTEMAGPDVREAATRWRLNETPLACSAPLSTLKSACLSPSAKKCLTSSMFFLLASFLLLSRPLSVHGSEEASTLDTPEGRDASSGVLDENGVEPAQENLLGSSVVSQSDQENDALPGDLHENHDAGLPSPAPREAAGESGVRDLEKVIAEDLSFLSSLATMKELTALSDVAAEANSDAGSLVDRRVSMLNTDGEDRKEDAAEGEETGDAANRKQADLSNLLAVDGYSEMAARALPESLLEALEVGGAVHGPRDETEENNQAPAADQEDRLGFQQEDMELTPGNTFESGKGAALRGVRYGVSDGSGAGERHPLPKTTEKQRKPPDSETRTDDSTAEELVVRSFLHGFPELTALLEDPPLNQQSHSDAAASFYADVGEHASTLSTTTAAEDAQDELGANDPENAVLDSEAGERGEAGNAETAAAQAEVLHEALEKTESTAVVEENAVEEPVAAISQSRSRQSVNQAKSLSVDNTPRVGKRNAVKMLASLGAVLSLLGGAAAAYRHFNRQVEVPTETGVSHGE
ncbi:hypothetical protein TGPRC2_244530 [Toxoplasma gondii TgCatPRC2]|uniref:Uncharacterized protein n=2 Tax=Toxoplasma gondii TaxID=5811 RepID=A0A151HRG4_TOXGO|nr:hypothetical protein TGME49_244530 [Toxoplasma gondii ME49]EPT30578.1 hypothetical protein TGME49_244530 [Toxoplasma gondii ME49]KYK71996.1 hypothetical protein TGPRC2_244530 [Toxoplasma gondii TgCatPRC2]|eukprot:XP_002366942.1 hypothetical protein TGME49_244530 [Toxoplasma gondii ME49]